MSADDSLISLHKVQAACPERYPFLLESVAHGPSQAHYDILLAFPDSRLELDGEGVLRLNGAVMDDNSFLSAFDAVWKQQRAGKTNPGLLPFSGGWFIYLGYEMADQIEPSLDLINNPVFPKALAIRTPAAIIRDHFSGQLTFFAENDDAAMLAQMHKDVLSDSATKSKVKPDLSLTEEDGKVFLRHVDRIKHYIREGDVFQVNLSRRWEAAAQNGASATELYRSLRKSNPGPFNGLALLNHSQAVISSSPERLVTARNGRVTVRPIAGTYPRGKTSVQDTLLSEQLTRHPKEKAEHIMLIDLERNDLGRICQPGSVNVDELMSVETYTHVHHIVSEVSGRLKENMTPSDIMQAVFPGGTITGCPKVRCMEIIAELEQAWRGPYTGSMGYVNHDGSMDLNILIRTMVLDGDTLSFRAGGGIVHDSVPERELEETRAKARGLIRGLQKS